ncbi:MAG: aminomethyl-transferring glycine dehydrogenase subunit GcvPB [Nitrososphaerota archaeon]
MNNEFRQARWAEPLLFEITRKNAGNYSTVSWNDILINSKNRAISNLPKNLLRDTFNLPEVSEVEVIRHFTRLSQMNYSVSTGFYPLGSCTMKYNPVGNEEAVTINELMNAHPLQDPSTVQGCLEILYRLEKMLCSVTGMDRFSFAPAAGAHGEFAGCLIMRKYHLDKGEKRSVVIVPDSAHGTNPASASMAGFEVEEVESDEHGLVNVERLKEMMGEDVAGLMLTNPNTLGLFERRIKEIVEIVRSYDGLLYYDGANLNAIAGIARPGDMGFDIVHLNLHKTFSTPHGGGGPGSGPVGVKDRLIKYLPPPLISYSPERGYYFEPEGKESIGRIRAFHGNFLVCVKAYAYLLRLGWRGLKEASEIAVLTSNYLLSKIKTIEKVTLPYDSSVPRKHEFVISLKKLLKETSVSAKDVAKRLLDYGFHAPTIYFPLIVEEAFMIEPTETEPKRELDRYADTLRKIINEAYTSAENVKNAPQNTSVKRVDEVKANHPRTLILSWKIYTKKIGVSNNGDA